ncbi:hypothetical protein MTR_0070s0080 [Medicago truncatula]|uniref:Uncharacterized protein n=1 Tax=Medicago truncatula TaxID=3880 RepID=A0A072TJ74_MEDTR|nr:hypothetical protein MTR_0070s0080 [Medicago truncatula]
MGSTAGNDQNTLLYKSDSKDFGITPVNIFWDKSKETKLTISPSDVGIDPYSLLSANESICNVCGRLPMKALEDKSISKISMTLQREEGILEFRLLDPMYNLIIELIFPKHVGCYMTLPLPKNQKDEFEVIEEDEDDALS